MLKIEPLLKPISDESPTGEDLSFSTEFDAIAEARRADDPTLEQGAWQTDLKKADWPQVIRIGEQLLRERSKDLRVAVWLVEAQTQLDGFAGLAWGYRLTARLCQQFRDGLFPRDDEDTDGSPRTGHVRWLLTHSAQWMQTLPITLSADGCFSASDIRAACQRGDLSDGDGGFITREQVDAARQSTPFEHFSSVSTTVQDCMVALADLETVINEMAGDDSPGFRHCRETLEQVLGIVTRFMRGHTAAATDAQCPAPESETNRLHAVTQQAIGSAPDHGHSRPVDGNGSSAELRSRDDALAQLRQVAAFFRRTEPQSPVAYLADKAAAWGEMPLHIWLRRVIKDDVALSHVEELLDVNQKVISE